jgi:hypothetical protein
MKSQSPAQASSREVMVTLEDLEGDVQLAKLLREKKSTDTSTDN